MSFLLFVFPYYTADCAEYEFYDEIPGYTSEEWNPRMAVDRDGMLWLCSKGRVFRFNGAIWEDFTEPSGGANYVSASSDGTLWFASDGHISRFDGIGWTYFPLEAIFSEDRVSVQALSTAANTIVWLAFYNYEDSKFYLARFDGENFETFHDELLHNYISRLTATPGGGVWIVYHNLFDATDCHEESCPKGTTYFDGTSFHHYSIHNGLPQWSPDTTFTDVSWIVFSSKFDDIYANCHTFFVKFQRGEWKIIADYIPRGILIEGPDKKLWQGFIGPGNQTNHLMCFDGYQWIEYDIIEVKSAIIDKYYDGSSPFPYTYSLAVTPDGTVWMGMSRGILRINPDSLPSTIKTNVDSDTLIPWATDVLSYPNPFNPSTTIQYTIPAYITEHVSIKVYDLRGAFIKTLVDQIAEPGVHSVIWDGTDKSGNKASSGIYIYRLQAGDFTQSNKMLLVR